MVGGAAVMNLSSFCLSETQMRMHGSEFEKYLQRYLFPLLAIFGILGNLLNLTVLLNRRMRSRANTFLATLALADICFLSLLLPNVLANYSWFTYNYYFRYFYFHTKVHLLSFTNWSSGVAIWCVIAVCADRLIGIRHPLYVKAHVAKYKMSLLIAAIVIFPGVLTFYQHFAHKCPVRSYCNGTQIYSKCLPINQDKWFGNQTNPYSESFRNFIDVSILLNVVFVIIFPIILLTALNMLLLCALRQRSNKLLMITSEDTNSSTKPCMDANYLKHHKTEQRVTLTVALIVTMFTVTNGPSAVVHLLQNLYQSEAGQKDWYNLVLSCSTLVIFGKASNFILFCLCSKHFRSRLFSLAQKKVHEKLDSRRRSSTTNPLGITASIGPSRKNTAVFQKTSTTQRPSQ
ncbi:serpentine type 7TM GPCR chemoreceptor srw domain-containing protein [Ditylenchus destructor]|uniref:Serpentine type 7TM GPCR chemoreceptor srw domain-containing protein n=1 Tax=Ditylenchus destructor TaxID=166010 RepID=A0AAD4RA52_9BILA|nr:serpentine type 7TM GPCR chemoreceptor srw domain-containing protein [Ditylenchus destructor]